jgi:FixJ family two-component response regulator
VTPAVLVIDDDESVRQSLAMLLEDWGYEVTAAASADEGLRKAREGRFAVVIVDHAMPGRTGLDALPDLRTAAPDAAILMLTGFGTPEIAREALRRGAGKFLYKPMDLNALYEAVREGASQGAALPTPLARAEAAP